MMKNLLYMAGSAVLVAALLPSCAKVEMIGSNVLLDPDQIAFGVTAGSSSLPETRSGEEEEKPVMLLSPQGGDTLYLHPSVVVNDRGFDVPATKGTPVEDASGIDSFTVTALVDGTNAKYMDEVEVKRVSDVWTTVGGKHFWPEDQTLDFYAYANIESTIQSTDSSVPVQDLEYQDGSLRFKYFVPKGSEGRDAERQPDILFALNSANRSQVQDGNGTVLLNFEHALAGIQFRAKNIAGGTIKSITIRNLYAEGSCEYVLTDAKDENGLPEGEFTWTLSGDKADFTQTMNVDVQESSTMPDNSEPQKITGNETTFMVIPQEIKDVEVEITLVGNLDKKTYIVAGKLSPTTWEPGHIYIYDISTDSINWTYVFEVTSSITLELGDTSANYTVTSYRYRTQNHSEIEPVAWTAKPLTATETNTNGGSSWTILDDILRGDKSTILTAFDYSGNGSADKSAVSYTLGMKRGTMHTTYSGDVTLQKAKEKGTATEPYDLSTHDWADNTIPETTANCYVVNAPGTYKLPLVYGNAIENGVPNTDAYNNSQFKDYNNYSIESPYISSSGDPYDCCLVWSDGFYMFKNVHLSEDKKYLVFTLDADFMQQANAILAVRDAAGNIMWSWHIWVTERDLYDTVHQLQDYSTGELNAYELMQCNLGWVDGKMVYFNSRDLEFEFTQTGSGETKNMTVKQNGAVFDYKDVGSTYYQWGRKDPIIALRNRDAVGSNDYRLHETTYDKYRYAFTAKQVSLGEAIRNPNVYYTRVLTPASGVTAQSWTTQATIDRLWDNSGHGDDRSSVKTIYDPSPRGFRVPTPRAYAVLVNGYDESGNIGGTLNGDIEESGYRYIVYPQRNKQGTSFPLTATGQRVDKEGLGELGGLWAMYGVYYWTCRVTGTNGVSTSLCIRKDPPGGEVVNIYTIGFSGTQTMARPVRPIKE